MIQNISITFGREGMNAPKSQLQDYVERGTELAAFPLIFFVADTYEERIKSKGRGRRARVSTDDDEVDVEDDADEGNGEDAREQEMGEEAEAMEVEEEGDGVEGGDGDDAGEGPDMVGMVNEDEEDFVERTGRKRRRGRRPNQRCRYLQGHPRWNSHQRVVRTPGHNTIPKTVGAFYPSHDDADRRDFFYASMLALCKPWRNLGDLKGENETWESAYDTFMEGAPKRIHHIVSGIKYHYDCRRSAAQRRIVPEDRAERAQARRVRNEFEEIVEAVQDEESDYEDEDEDGEEREELELARAIDEEQNSREEVHGKAALDIARQCNVFRDAALHWEVTGPRAGVATGDDLMNLERWQAALQASLTSDQAQRTMVEDADTGTVAMDSGEEATVQYVPENLGVGENELSAVDPSHLFPEQRRVYDIVDRQLQKMLAGESPEQLLMHVPGEGGVGKSKVIQTITENFKRRGVEHMLAKGAYTGIAASLIGGRTLHTLGRIPIRQPKPETKRNPRTERMLAEYWSTRSFLIIDEISMVSKKLMAALSENIGRARAHLPDHSTPKPFGGLNVILFGDMHQFPPVIGGVSSALFVPTRRCDIGDKKKKDAIKGRSIYLQFETVVKLRKQVRIVDEKWRNLLQKARHGNCGADDIRYLRHLILTNRECPPVDFSQAPWKDAVLITPRHSVRRHYNSAYVRQHCEDTKTTLYISSAADLINGRALTVKEKLAVLGLKHVPLPGKCELAIGAKVMVTFNVETELDITNGSRGFVHGIVLDEKEPVSEGPEVHLKYPPAYILVKLDRTKAPKLSGLPEGVVPIKPMTKDMLIHVNGRKVKVTRTSLPMTLAYSLTDFRAQGQTMNNILVDIGWPPSGGLTSFNAYVALSRSSGADTIRLLREFEPKLFTKHPSEYLRQEDKRLERLDRETKAKWDPVFTRSVGSASRNKAY